MNDPDFKGQSYILFDIGNNPRGGTGRATLIERSNGFRQKNFLPIITCNYERAGIPTPSLSVILTKEVIMVYLLVHHKVKDYGTWKPLFDEHEATRKAGGSKGARLLRNVNDGNDLVIVISWTDLQHAQAFINSPDLHAVMQKAGVVGEPEVLFLEEVEQTPA